MWFTKKTTWADSPSTTTPITAAELLRLENGIDILDTILAGTAFTSATNLNGRFAWHGDSQNLFGEGWPPYVCALSNASVRPVLITSNSGYTTAQLLSVIDAQIINVTPKPGVCVIQGGANDAQSAVTVATFSANIIAMVNKLRVAQITPILTTVLPNANATYDANVRLYNAWLRNWCPDNDVMFAELHTAVANSAGGWLTGMADADGLHPSPAGDKAIATAFVNSLLPVIPPRGSTIQLSSGSPNLIPNSAMLTDTTPADGIPDGFVSTGLTPTYLVDPTYGFKWARITGSGTTLGKVSTPEITTGYAVGDVLRFSARIRSGQSIATLKAGLLVQLVCYDNAYAVKGNWLVASPNGGLSQMIYDGVCALEFTVPTGTTKIIVSLSNSLFDGSAGVLGTYDMALPTLVNLTTLGITL